MQLKLEKFLKITAVLASAGALAVGCTVNQDVDDNPNTGGTGGGSAGTGGGAAGSAGSSGSGGTAGSSGSGGTAGSSGAGGSAGADAGTECLGDTGSNPDAGVEGLCAGLTYYKTFCPGDADAGVEGAFPPGAQLCDYMATYGRAGVTEELFNCLNALPAASACDASHTTGVNACISSVFPQACDTGGVTFPDAGVVTCQDVATACPAVTNGTAGITAQECQDSINAMNPQTRMDIMRCFDNSGGNGTATGPNTGDCADDFTACVFDIDSY